MSDFGSVDYCFILEIPDEILLKIIQDSCLSIEDIFNISITCKRLSNICGTQAVWRRKFSDRWPWIWNQIIKKEHTIEDWKLNSSKVENFQRRLRKHLSTLSEQLYTYEHITCPVLQSIFTIYPDSKFSHVYCYDELRRLIASINRHPTRPRHLLGDTVEQNNVVPPDIQQNAGRPNWIRVLPTTNESGDLIPIKLPTYENLTECYYAKKLQQFIHIEICKEEWNEFLNTPSEAQCLEKGATLIEKWVGRNLELTHEQISRQLDVLAEECRGHLKSLVPNHPAAVVPLRRIDEPLSKTMWTVSEAKQVFQSINYILYEKHRFEGNTESYYSKDNSFISRVLYMKKGIPITLCIIYAAICHRLGVHLEPLNFPRHFVLRWLIPGTSDYEFIDAYGNGKRMNKLELVRSVLPMSTDPDKVDSDQSCTYLNVYERMANNLYRLCRQEGKLEGVWLVLELQMLLSTQSDREAVLFTVLFGLYARLEINYDKIIEGCNSSLQADTTMQNRASLVSMKEEFMKLLAQQREGPPLIVPKERVDGAKNSKIAFATGMVMKHKLYNYICVIYGWDPVCAMPEEWMIRMNVYALKNSKNQPFYQVMVADGSNRYAAEENLLFVEPTIVTHPEIGKFFKSFNGLHYVPNEQLRQQYPDDQEVRKGFYSHS